MNPMKTLWQSSFLPICFSLILLFSGCGGNKAGGGGFSMPPMPVEIAPVTVQKVADKFGAVGTIEALEAITVVSEIDAAVVGLPFHEGSEINRRGLIAQLDDSQLS